MQGFDGPAVVLGTTLFKAIDDAAASMLDDFDVSVTNRVELSMLVAAVFEVPAPGVEGSSLFKKAAVGPVHRRVILIQV